MGNSVTNGMSSVDDFSTAALPTTEKEKAIALYKVMVYLGAWDHESSFAVRMRLAELNTKMGVCMNETALAPRTGYWRAKCDMCGRPVVKQ